MTRSVIPAKAGIQNIWIPTFVGMTGRESEDMGSKIIVRENEVILWFKECPLEETEKWGEAYRSNIPKTQKGILKGVPDPKTFHKKIAKPLIDNVEKMLKDGCVNRKGLSKEAIMALMRAKLKGKNPAKKYEQNVKLGFQAFDQDDLNSAMAEYNLSQSFGEYRFREAIEKALGCLLPIIQPGKEGRFKLKFSNQLKSSGKLISELAYDPAYIKPENDKINALVNEYIREDIVSFSTGGESHCAFVLIKESVTPANSTKVKEIKYKIYKRFLGEEQANKLRATWIVMDEPSAPPNPDEYLGNHTDLSKQAYFDMNMDVQVSRLQ